MQHSRFWGNHYISEHLLLAAKECAFSIIQSAVFVQTNTKIHPHKPVLKNIIIYTSDSSLFFKKKIVSLNCEVCRFLFFLFSFLF